MLVPDPENKKKVLIKYCSEVTEMQFCFHMMYA